MIPKQIFICHKTAQMVEKFSAPAWRALNPDYEVIAYGNQECQRFLLEQFGQLHLDVFDYIKDPPIKADFWRVCILYKLGGVYADADIEPLVPISRFLEPGIVFLTVKSHSHNLNPHLIISVPRHAILEKCIDTYLSFYSTKKPYTYWGWSITHMMHNVLMNELHTTQIAEGVYGNYQLIQEVYPSSADKTNEYCSYKGVKLLMNRSAYYNPDNHTFSKVNQRALMPKIMKLLRKSVLPVMLGTSIIVSSMQAKES